MAAGGIASVNRRTCTCRNQRGCQRTEQVARDRFDPRRAISAHSGVATAALCAIALRARFGGMRGSQPIDHSLFVTRRYRYLLLPDCGGITAARHTQAGAGICLKAGLTHGEKTLPTGLQPDSVNAWSKTGQSLLAAVSCQAPGSIPGVGLVLAGV
jgi:hypothetical protein